MASATGSRRFGWRGRRGGCSWGREPACPHPSPLPRAGEGANSYHRGFRNRIRPLKKSDFHFDLPSELIAQAPLAERSASRLLVVDAARNRLEDRRFTDLVELLAPGDLLVFNDTRVLPARLYGRKETGGAVEILIERITGAHEARAQLGVSKKPKAGGRILFEDGSAATVTGRDGEFFLLRFDAGEPRRKAAAAARTHAAAAVHRARCGCGGRGTLPDRLCARGRRGRGADGGPAFRCAAARCAAHARRRFGLRDAARRRRHVPAGAQRAHRGSRHASRMARRRRRARRKDPAHARARRARRRGRHDGRARARNGDARR